MAENYYSILGVARDASAQDIKSAYRRLARELHPDKNAGDTKAAERFKEITRAHNVLGDPQKRRDYDSQMKLQNNFGQSTAAAPPHRPAADPAADARVEEVMQRMRETAARMQEDNRRAAEKLKGAVPESSSQEPSVEELRDEFYQSVEETAKAIGDFFGNVKKKADDMRNRPRR